MGDGHIETATEAHDTERQAYDEALKDYTVSINALGRAIKAPVGQSQDRALGESQAIERATTEAPNAELTRDSFTAFSRAPPVQPEAFKRATAEGPNLELMCDNFADFS